MIKLAGLEFSDNTSLKSIYRSLGSLDCTDKGLSLLGRLGERKNAGTSLLGGFYALSVAASSSFFYRNAGSLARLLGSSGFGCSSDYSLCFRFLVSALASCNDVILFSDFLSFVPLSGFAKACHSLNLIVKYSPIKSSFRTLSSFPENPACLSFSLRIVTVLILSSSSSRCLYGSHGSSPRKGVPAAEYCDSESMPPVVAPFLFSLFI